MAPLVITTSYPDYKRPEVKSDYKIVNASKIDALVMDLYVKSLIDIQSGQKIVNVEDIDCIIESFCDGCCMPGEFFEAKAVINGEWKDVTPTFLQLFEVLEKKNLTTK